MKLEVGTQADIQILMWMKTTDICLSDTNMAWNAIVGLNVTLSGHGGKLLTSNWPPYLSKRLFM